ncbi:MAG: dTDP-4-dehydrorhamnose reductase [Betaproteobacteria bacterium]
MTLRILITGALGQVGHELQRTLAPLGLLTAVDVADLDVTNTDAVCGLLRALRPHVLVNPAAFTAVDRAETEEPLAMAVNGTAPGVMAEEMARLGGLMVHYSTDYVFGGAGQGAWREDAPANPLSAYGRSKLAGEQAVRAAGGAHVILRTSWVYGRHGANFMRTILRLAQQREELRVVADQFGAPTWSRTVAAGTAQVIRHAWLDPATRTGAAQWSGVYHLTNGGVTTWHGFAQAIVELAPELATRRQVRVLPISTGEYLLPARRPANSVLDNTRIEQVFGVRQVPWEDDLKRCLAE